MFAGGHIYLKERTQSISLESSIKGPKFLSYKRQSNWWIKFVNEGNIIPSWSLKTQASLDSMPKDMRNTKENKRNIKSKKESIDVPEFEDLRWSRVVCPYKQTSVYWTRVLLTNKSSPTSQEKVLPLQFQFGWLVWAHWQAHHMTVLQTMMCVPFKIGVVELGSTALLLQGKKLDSPEAVLRALTLGVDSIQSCNSKPENSNEEDDDTVPTVQSKTVTSAQIVKRCRSSLRLTVSFLMYWTSGTWN